MKNQHLAPPFIRKFLYYTISFLFYSSLRLVWRMKVIGRENVPEEGPLIIAPNHVSNVDPPLVGCIVSRSVHIFAKQELFEVPVFGWIIRQINAFPVRRMEHDIGAFKRAYRLLKEGKAILMFPEGFRSKDGKLGSAKPGVGLLAEKAGARVVPVYIHNTQNLWRLKKISVYFGLPLEIGEGKNARKFSQEIMEHIAELRNQRISYGS